MRLIFTLIICAITNLAVVHSNTEKVVFLGPKQYVISWLEVLNLDSPHIRTITPKHGLLKTFLPAEFPSSSSKLGRESWILLHGLTEGQRYEVRICWAATQPTSFSLKTYDIVEVLDSTELKSSLARSCEPVLPKFGGSTEIRKFTHRGQKNLDEQLSSMLLLQIFAAADFYTTNSSLMKDVPLVHVDIILDPYSFNICPSSLISTAVYIFVLAISGWLISNKVCDMAEAFHRSQIKVHKKQ